MKTSILASPEVTTLLIPFVLDINKENKFLCGGVALNFLPKFRKVQRFHSATDAALVLLLMKHKLHGVSTFSVCVETE
jgi:hypothetical protein